MHKFLRAVGFSEVKTRDQLKPLIAKTIKDHSSESGFITHDEDSLLAEYSLHFGENMGLTVCGEMDEEDNFVFEYCYPFFKGTHESSRERSVIERHAATISYAGVCEDNKIGISIIYYLLNRIEFLSHSYKQKNDLPGITLSLSGLASSGTIMMPLAKDKGIVKKAKTSKRNKLVEAARNGDESAIESLTLDDLDVYSTISQKIKEADVYTLVETYFMPYGVECDQYSIMGEITELKEVKNTYSGEEVFQMTLMCNEIPMDICINKRDLFGEPKVGRRFKGVVWLQGFLNFPLS